jgi:hypothetical protein
MEEQMGNKELKYPGCPNCIVPLVFTFKVPDKEWICPNCKNYMELLDDKIIFLAWKDYTQEAKKIFLEDGSNE